MKFSILIANYNNGKYFADCYSSIIAQKYKDWEAIILDDASIDNSIETIENLIGGDSRFKIYKNEKNSGVGITKSKLIELATGDICGFVDPDDAISPNAISSSINAYKKDKKVVLTYSNFVKCDENLQPKEIFKSGMQVPNHDPYFFNCPVHIVHFVTFKRAIYGLTEKMNSQLEIAEDQDLYLKMYEKGKVHFIDKINYFYRIHSGGISQNDNRPKAREFFGRVIFNTMKRRNLTSINGKPVPETYTNFPDIFSLLDYQISIMYRIRKKIKVFSQKILNV